MTKANEYGIKFQIIQSDINKEPLPINFVNDRLVYDIASFIESLGVEFTDWVLDEINSLDTSNIFGDGNGNGYAIEGSMDTIVEIFSSPTRAAFPDTNGGFLELPLQDFIDILEEWKSFLKTKHLYY